MGLTGLEPRYDEDEATKQVRDSNRYTRNYLDSLLLEYRNIDAVEPTTEFEFLGEKFSTPIMTGAFAQLERFEGKNDLEWAAAVKEAGAVLWYSYTDDEQFKRICDLGIRPIRVIKPLKDNEKVIRLIEESEKAGALAVSMDILHGLTDKGEEDVFKGEKLSCKSTEEIRSYCQASSLPFIPKGVTSTWDAQRCLEAGCKGMVITHHWGTFDYAVPSIVLLPEIEKMVAGRVPVLCDGTVTSGVDAYKYMALGADGVLSGRSLLRAYCAGGPSALIARIRTMTAQLKGAMWRTAIPDLKHFDPTVLRRLPEYMH